MRAFASLSPRTVGYAAAATTVAMWTSFIVISRAAADPTRAAVLHPLDITLLRLLGAAAVLLPIGAWIVRRDRALGRPAQESCLFGLAPLPWRLTVLTGLFGGLFYALLAYHGFMLAPAGHAAVLMPGSLPLWTTLLAAWLLATPVSGARALGLALIVGGDLLVGGRSLLHAFEGGTVWLGDLLFMAAAFVWSVYGVVVRRFALDAVRATAALTAFGFCCFVPVYVALQMLGWPPLRLFEVPLGTLVFQALFQGVGSVAIAGVGFTLMVRHFGPVRSTMLTALVPGLAALSAVLFLGEPLQWNLVLGLMLVSLGIVFGVRAVAAPASVTPASPSRGAAP